eukprot:GHVU01011976.1.p1 GENE.GHVU01011976.1~~GHVU01011976.1.p1  ORF type:complete len:102 (+),score=4.30 GHVU01011976.1:205-510(+)
MQPNAPSIQKNLPMFTLIKSVADEIHLSVGATSVHMLRRAFLGSHYNVVVWSCPTRRQGAQYTDSAGQCHVNFQGYTCQVASCKDVAILKEIVRNHIMLSK